MTGAAFLGQCDNYVENGPNRQVFCRVIQRRDFERGAREGDARVAVYIEVRQVHHRLQREGIARSIRIM